MRSASCSFWREKRRCSWMPTWLGGTPYGFMGHICHLRPDSRGTIAPLSPDPLAAPRIQGNYLTAQTDKLAMRSGFRKLEEIFSQSAFTGLRKRRVNPGEGLQSDDEVDDWIASNASTVFHPVGTCKMGLDDMAVVDDQLRVRGIAGLRVIDASIMPLLISANTQSATIMIAERGAEWILEDAKQALQANS